jgi:hypothetical protein
MNPNSQTHSEPAEGTRMSTDADLGVPEPDSARERERRDRFSSQRNLAAVLRLLRGESQLNDKRGP